MTALIKRKARSLVEPSAERLRSLFGRASQDDLASLFARHGVDPEQGTDPLVEKICLDGSNTIASLFRGWEGVPYAEVVGDVARKLGIKGLLASSEDEAELERAIIGKVVERYLSKASSAEKEEIEAILEKAGVEAKEFARAVTTGTLAVVIAVLRREIIAQIVRAVAARAGARAAATGAARLVGLAVPLLNLVLAAWTVFDVSGPAFRKTVPSIIEIALMRIEYERE